MRASVFAMTIINKSEHAEESYAFFCQTLAVDKIEKSRAGVAARSPLNGAYSSRLHSLKVGDRVPR